MANPNLPIEAQYTPGRNLHVVRHNPDGKVWNVTDQEWQVYDNTKWSEYAITMTEQTGSGYYRVGQTIPDLDVNTTDAVYERISPTPTLPSDSGGDVLLGMGQSQGANVMTISESFEAASNLSFSAGSMEQGTVVDDVDNSVSQVKTDLTSTLEDAYRGRVIIFTSGDLIRVAAIIKSFDPDTGILGFTDIPQEPTADDTFIVV